jgi:hypothetical protein
LRVTSLGAPEKASGDFVPRYILSKPVRPVRTRRETLLQRPDLRPMTSMLAPQHRLSGKSVARFTRSVRGDDPEIATMAPRRKIHFASRIRVMSATLSRSRKKYFRIIRNCDFLTASRLGKRDVSADRHDTWGGEAVAVMPAPDERKSSRR